MQDLRRIRGGKQVTETVDAFAPIGRASARQAIVQPVLAMENALQRVQSSVSACLEPCELRALQRGAKSGPCASENRAIRPGAAQRLDDLRRPSIQPDQSIFRGHAAAAERPQAITLCSDPQTDRSIAKVWDLLSQVAKTPRRGAPDREHALFRRAARGHYGFVLHRRFGKRISREVESHGLDNRGARVESDEYVRSAIHPMRYQ